MNGTSGVAITIAFRASNSSTSSPERPMRCLRTWSTSVMVEAT